MFSQLGIPSSWNPTCEAQVQEDEIVFGTDEDRIKKVHWQSVDYLMTDATIRIWESDNISLVAIRSDTHVDCTCSRIAGDEDHEKTWASTQEDAEWLTKRRYWQLRPWRETGELRMTEILGDSVIDPSLNSQTWPATKKRKSYRLHVTVVFCHHRFDWYDFWSPAVSERLISITTFHYPSKLISKENYWYSRTVWRHTASVDDFSNVGSWSGCQCKWDTVKYVERELYCRERVSVFLNGLQESLPFHHYFVARHHDLDIDPSWTMCVSENPFTLLFFFMENSWTVTVSFPHRCIDGSPRRLREKEWFRSAGSKSSSSTASRKIRSNVQMSLMELNGTSASWTMRSCAKRVA